MSGLPEHVAADERAIVESIVREALTSGYAVSVYDGEELTVDQARDWDDIVGALATTDEDVLRFHDEHEHHVGDIALIWGNGNDLVSDYSDTPEMARLVKNVREDDSPSARP